MGRPSLPCPGALLLLLLLAPAPAPAAPPVDEATALARADFDAAEKAYALGHFEDALAGYARAYDRKPLPAFLFNIGQCHRNLGHWERARFFFEGYLLREPKARNRDGVQALIDQMDAKVREDEARRAAAAAAPPPAVAPAAGLTPEAGAAPARGATTGSVPAAPSPGAPSPGALSPGALSPGALSPGALSIVPAPAGPAAPAPVPAYRKWWVWTIVGVVVVGAAVAATAVALNPSVSTASLNGSLGGPIDATR